VALPPKSPGSRPSDSARSRNLTTNASIPEEYPPKSRSPYPSPTNPAGRHHLADDRTLTISTPPAPPTPANLNPSTTPDPSPRNRHSDRQNRSVFVGDTIRPGATGRIPVIGPRSTASATPFPRSTSSERKSPKQSHRPTSPTERCPRQMSTSGGNVR
jgi:hypothetical protein